MKFTLESQDINDLLSEALRARGWAVPDSVQYRFSDDGTGHVQVEIYGVDLPTKVSRREVPIAPLEKPYPQALGAQPQADPRRTKTAAPAKPKTWFEDPTVPPPPPGPAPKKPKRVELKDRAGGPERAYRATPKYGLAEPGEKQAASDEDDEDAFVYTPQTDYEEAPPKGFAALKVEAQAEDTSDDDEMEDDGQSSTEETEDDEDPRPGARMVSSRLEDFGDPTNYRNEM